MKEGKTKKNMKKIERKNDRVISNNEYHKR